MLELLFPFVSFATLAICNVGLNPLDFSGDNSAPEIKVENMQTPKNNELTSA